MLIQLPTYIVLTSKILLFWWRVLLMFLYLSDFIVENTPPGHIYVPVTFLKAM